MILGVNPWRTVWELWPRLIGEAPRYDPRPSHPELEAPALRRGRRLEDAVGGWYAEEADLSLTECPKVGGGSIQGPEAWMADRPDFLAGGGGPPRTLLLTSGGYLQGEWDRAVEVKTARYLDGWGRGGDQVPLHVAAQCIWHLACTGLDRCDVVAFGTVADSLRTYRLDARQDLLEAVVGAVRAWYVRHVVERVPPPLDGSERSVRHAHLVHRYGGERTWVEATDLDRALASDLHRARARVVEAKAHLASLQAQALERTGDQYGVRAGSQDLWSWGPRRGAQRVDVGRLRLELGAKADRYFTKGKAGRTFRLAKPVDEEQ